MKNGPDPVYDEEFELDDIPPDVLTVAVTVFNKVNMSFIVFHQICPHCQSSCDVFCVKLRLKHLKNNLFLYKTR